MIVSGVKVCKGSHKIDLALDIVLNGLMLVFIVLPQFAHAQTDPAGAFSGATAFLKGFANVLIFEWGYYLGRLSLP